MEMNCRCSMRTLMTVSHKLDESGSVPLEKHCETKDIFLAPLEDTLEEEGMAMVEVSLLVEFMRLAKKKMSEVYRV